MSKLIILRGNSGSGKSTVAKELQKHFGYDTMLISQDVIRREILSTRDGPGTLALPLMEQILEYGHKHCEIVILEGILRADCYSGLFKKAVELFENNIFAYYYDIPFEETLRRHETKPSEIQNRFGENDMRRWWKDKDYIGFIYEKPLYTNSTVADTVKMICEDVSA